MELKIKYQYSYFLHLFMVKENRYVKYILKLLKNPNCKLRIFQKEKDIGIYTHFVPKIRNYMFSTFTFNKSKIKNFEELSLDTRAAILAKMPCVMFEYNFPRDIQGKTEENEGIFFNIQKVEIICFNTGICFLNIKTNVEDSNKFSDILNFNYKFRNMTSDEELSGYDNIKILADKFDDVKTFRAFIKELTGPNQLEIKNIDIDTERFLTFSYTWLEQEAWTKEEDFNNIKSMYMKYVKILSNDNNTLYNLNEAKILSNWNYAKLGMTKAGTTLFTSGIEINNYTVLPHQYENEYLYTYILSVYMKIYIKLINLELREGIDVQKARKKFVDFTKNLWIQETTIDDIGTEFYHNLRTVLELDNLYLETKNQYDVLYKEMNIEKNTNANKIIIVILTISLIVTTLNFMALMGFI